MTEPSTLDVYTHFFGLSERPFSLVPNPKFVYWSDYHRKAWAILEYGVLTRSPITLLTGDIGAGKSTLLFHFLNQAGPDLRVGLVANAHGDRGELLHWVLLSLGLEPDGNESYVRLFGRLQEFLIAEYAAGRRVVLIFDEAQNLSRESLEELRMLTNINSGADELLQLVLVGQPELRQTIRHPSLKQFAQRVAASVHLPAMDASMVEAYLDHRMQVAGSQAKVFNAKAAEAIYKATGGVPRLVNQLADLALVYAYTNEERSIDGALVEQVLSEGVFMGIRSLDDDADAGSGPVLMLRRPLTGPGD